MLTFKEFVKNLPDWAYILLIVILFTGLTILYYMKKQDVYDKEPIGRLILAFFFGILSTIIPLIVNTTFSIVVGKDMIGVAVIAPIIEESSKAFFVLLLARHRSFDGPIDGLIYGAMVGAGFAFTENIIYGLNSLYLNSLFAGILVTSVRSVFQITGHPFYTALAGYSIGKSKTHIIGHWQYKMYRPIFFHAFWNFINIQLSGLLSLLGMIIISLIYLRILRGQVKFAIAKEKDAYERDFYVQKKAYLKEHGKNRKVVSEMRQEPWFKQCWKG